MVDRAYIEASSNFQVPVFNFLNQDLRNAFHKLLQVSIIYISATLKNF